jgi:hypothetical protein
VSRALERFESHLVMETSRPISDSSSRGRPLVRDPRGGSLVRCQDRETLGEMPRERLLV